MHRASTIATALALAVSCVLSGCDSLSGEELDLAACEVTSDCMLAQNTCCGSCGPLSPAGVTAIHRAAADIHERRVCGEDDVGCPGIACSPQPPTLVAACDAGRCVAVELARHPSTACSAPAECAVRSVMCCECNAPTHRGAIVAVSDGDAFAELVCDPSQPCDECGAIYPAEVTATCESGRCVAQDPRPF